MVYSLCSLHTKVTACYMYKHVAKIVGAITLTNMVFGGQTDPSTDGKLKST